MNDDDVEAHCDTWRALRARAAGCPSEDAWEIVFRFYAALHITQAFLILDGRQPKDHTDRRDAIISSPKLGTTFFGYYNRLQGMSRSVRYDPLYTVEQRHIDAARSALSDVETRLKPLIAIGGHRSAVAVK